MAPPRTRANQAPEIETPDSSNLFKLDLGFLENDGEVLIKNPEFINAITRYFGEAAELNTDAKELITKRTKKKVPLTPKKKTAQTNLVLEELSVYRKLDFDDEEDSTLIEEPVPSPRKQSPKKPIPSHARGAAGGDAHFFASTPPFSSNSDHSPARGPFTRSHVTPAAGPSRITKPIVPKAAIIKNKDPNLIEKLRINGEKAEERRNDQLQEKQERLRREREEKEKKIKERRLQMEEDNRRKLEAAKLNNAKVKEFEAKQREEARPVLLTPKQDKKKREVLTPRNAHIPPKKGKDIPQNMDFDISSPPRKHKKPTPPKAQVVESEPDVSEQEDSTGNEELNYVELTPAEAQAEIRGRKVGTAGRALSFDSYASDGTETPSKASRSSDVVSETIHFQTSTYTAPQRMFEEVIQDSVVEDSAVADSVVEEIKTEPMEEDAEEENDENAQPKVNKSSYDITADKIFLPSTETNYNVDDLSSNDETDDESKPRKTVPNWAKKHELNTLVKKMLKDRSTENRIAYFGSIQQPNLKFLFGLKNVRHRNSSGIWNSPLHQPTAGISRLPRR